MSHVCCAVQAPWEPHPSSPAAAWWGEGQTPSLASRNSSPRNTSFSWWAVFAVILVEGLNPVWSGHLGTFCLVCTEGFGFQDGCVQLWAQLLTLPGLGQVTQSSSCISRLAGFQLCDRNRFLFFNIAFVCATSWILPEQTESRSDVVLQGAANRIARCRSLLDHGKEGKKVRFARWIPDHSLITRDLSSVCGSVKSSQTWCFALPVLSSGSPLEWKHRTGGGMTLSRQWHGARTQSGEIKGEGSRHTEQSDLPKSAQPDLLTPSLSLLWLPFRRWSWLIEIALFTDYHFNNLPSNVRNPAWEMVFLVQSVCHLHFSRVGVKIRPVVFSFYLYLGLCSCHPGITQCYCCSCILTWQGNILITRKWKLKTKTPPLPK